MTSFGETEKNHKNPRVNRQSGYYLTRVPQRFTATQVSPETFKETIEKSSVSVTRTGVKFRMDAAGTALHGSDTTPCLQGKALKI